MNVINILITIAACFGLFFSMIYVYFPKSSLARHKITKVGILIYGICTIIFLGYTILAAFLIW